MKRPESIIENADVPLEVALFELAAADGEDYPADDGATTVYWGIFCSAPTFEESPGERELSFTASSEGAYLWHDAGTYYEEGSVVLAERFGLRWFIQGLLRAPE